MPMSLVKELLMVHNAAEQMKADEFDKMKNKSELNNIGRNR